MRVHPRAVATIDRLGHEGGDEAVPDGDGPHDEPQGGQMVGQRQRVRGAEIDLVLAAGHFVMRRLRAEPHLFQRRHDHPARLLPPIDRDQVEVAAGVEGPRRRLAALVLLEDEELHLAPDVHGEAQRGGALDLTLQRGTRAPLERAAVGVADVADQPRHAPTVVAVVPPALPREHPEAGEVGYQQRIRLLHAGEPLQRRTVEAHLAGQRLVELRGRDLHRLVHAQQIGELQQQEPHVPLLQVVQDLAGFGHRGGKGR